MHCLTHITMNSSEKNMIMVIHQTIGIAAYKIFFKSFTHLYKKDFFVSFGVIDIITPISPRGYMINCISKGEPQWSCHIFILTYTLTFMHNEKT